MKKVTAEGMHSGKKVILECIEDGDITFLKDGEEDIATKMLFIEHIAKQRVKNRNAPCVWLPQENSAEAYWAAFHEIYFDEIPKIKVEGELDTFGSAYSEEDIDGVVF